MCVVEVKVGEPVAVNFVAITKNSVHVDESKARIPKDSSEAHFILFAKHHRIKLKEARSN